MDGKIFAKQIRKFAKDNMINTKVRVIKDNEINVRIPRIKQDQNKLLDFLSRSLKVKFTNSNSTESWKLIL